MRSDRIRPTVDSHALQRDLGLFTGVRDGIKGFGLGERGFPAATWGKFGEPNPIASGADTAGPFPLPKRDFVFELAREMTTMDGPYMLWVRQQIIAHVNGA